VNAAIGGYLRDMAFAQTSEQKSFGYKRAANAILALESAISAIVEPDGRLPRISGIGPASARIIREVLETGTSMTVERAMDNSTRRTDIERRRTLRYGFLSRAEVLRVLTRGKPVQDIDYDHVAKKSDGFSGADLMAVVNRAIEGKLNEAMKRGVPSPLTTADLLASAKGLRATTKEWFSTARNYAMYSNEAGVYDDILSYLKLK